MQRIIIESDHAVSVAQSQTLDESDPATGCDAMPMLEGRRQPEPSGEALSGHMKGGKSRPERPRTGGVLGEGAPDQLGVWAGL